MKKRLAIFLCLVLLVTALSVPVFATETSDSDASTAWDGSIDTSWYNTTDTSFEIDTPAKLAGLAAIANGTAEGITRNNFSGKTVTLTADVDLGSRPWTAIGNSSSCIFSGIFDGGGHTIRNITFNPSDAYAGLFGYNNNGTIKNIIVTGAYAPETCSNQCLGAIVGYSYGTSNKVINCIADVDINITSQTEKKIGGVVGYSNYKGYVSSCANLGDITVSGSGSLYIGGVAGMINSSYMYNCYNMGNISTETTTSSYSGGIVGWASCVATNVKLFNCYNAGNVSATYNASAVVYISGSVRPTNCYYLKTDTVNAGLTGQLNQEDAAGNVEAKSESELKAAAELLGGAFAADNEGDKAINGGYPVLTCQKTGEYLVEAEALTVNAIESASNGTITVATNLTLVYTNSSELKNNFHLTVTAPGGTPQEAAVSSVSAGSGNTLNVNFTAMAAEASAKEYTFSLRYLDGEEKTGTFQVPGLTMENFTAGNGSLSAKVDQTLTATMVPLDDFQATISKDGGAASH